MVTNQNSSRIAYFPFLIFPIWLVFPFHKHAIGKMAMQKWHVVIPAFSTYISCNKFAWFQHISSFGVIYLQIMFSVIYHLTLIFKDSKGYSISVLYREFWIGLCIKKLSWPMKLQDLVVWIFFLRYLEWADSQMCPRVLVSLCEF
jgi:hypothetical protein